MKKDSKKLLFIAIVAFICFLIAYGNAFYECGRNGGTEGLAIAFIFPVFYLILLAAALILMHNTAFTKRPYIVLSILSIGFMLVMWIVYICATLTQKDSDAVLWFPIVMTVLSLIMSLCYVSLIIDIVKADKEVKRNTESNTN